MTEAELYSVYRGVYVPALLHSPGSLRYFEEFPFRPDDVVIATYPRSGPTWTQELVPLILSGGDPAAVEALPSWERAPWLEETFICGLDVTERPSPRILTTHFQHDVMPPSFFEVNPKVVYVTRNPRDGFTSFFHYHGMVSHLVNPGLRREFLLKFLDGKGANGSWFDHVKSWLNAEDQRCLMFISYEEMITVAPSHLPGDECHC